MTESILIIASRSTRSLAVTLLVVTMLCTSLAVCGAAHSPVQSDSTGTDDSIPLEFYLESARTAYQNQQWDIAEMEYQNVLIRESTNLAAIVGLADVYEQLGKYEHARGLLSRASALDTNNKKLIKRALELEQKLNQSLRIEVDTLLACGSYELALPKLSLLMTLNPENPDLYYQKSLCHYHLSRYDIALAAIETALRLRGEIAYHDLHELIINRMKQLEIHTLMRKAATVINPKTEVDLQSALTQLAKIIELDPDNRWAKQEFLRLSESGTPSSAIADDNQSMNLGFTGKAWRATGAAIVYLGRLFSQYLELLLIILAILLLFHSPLTRSLLQNFPHSSVLSGDLSRFNITEILTLISSHDYTGTLVIKGKAISGAIYFDHGDAYHCKTKRLTGREAICSILNGAKDGRFYFTKTKSPVERTIDIPLSLLMMDLPARTTSAQPLQSRKRAKSKISELLESR